MSMKGIMERVSGNVRQWEAVGGGAVHTCGADNRQCGARNTEAAFHGRV